MLAEKKAFLETNMYMGNKSLYGTPKAEVQRIIDLKKIPVLEIDVNGKNQIDRIKKELGFEVISIFVAAPVKAMYERLVKRGETTASISQRIQASQEEILSAKQYDVVIVNHNINESLKQMQDILREK